MFHNAENSYDELPKQTVLRIYIRKALTMIQNANNFHAELSNILTWGSTWFTVQTILNTLVKQKT